VTLARERLALERSLYEFLKSSWRHFESVPFTDNWHLKEICDELQAMVRFERTELPRVVLNQPPGSCKTSISSVVLPSWVWTWWPQAKFQYVCVNAGPLYVATKKQLQLLKSPWYTERWGKMLANPAGVVHFDTLFGGGRLNTTPGGQGIGMHGDFLICDDMIKPVEATGGYAITGSSLESAWVALRDTFFNRARNPNRFGILIQGQRLHEDDPPGRALAQGGWEHVCFPMRFEPENADKRDPRTEEGEILDKARFSDEALAEKEKEPSTWQTQYQQRPFVPGGSIVKEEWIEKPSCTRAEFDAVSGMSLQSWDLTFTKSETSDMVAGQHWKIDFREDGPHFFGRVIFFQRATFLETLDAMEKAKTTAPAGKILVEKAANGSAIENVLSQKWPNGLLELVTPGTRSKAARLMGPAEDFANLRVHLVRDEHYERLKTTLMKFPRVRFDDEIDALSQAINFAKIEYNPLIARLQAFR
jgi:hypothetical protein